MIRRILDTIARRIAGCKSLRRKQRHSLNHRSLAMEPLEERRMLAADLVVDDVWTNPVTVVSGQSFQIFATVRNAGNSTADAGLFANQEALFFLNGQQMGEGDDYDNLAAGVSITVQSPSITGPSSGQHSIRVTADGNSEVAESNESNNSRTESITVSPPPRPDLIANSVSVSDSTVNPGQSITVNWTARNQGQASAGSTQQGVMWSTNNTINLSDVLLEKEFLGSMGVNVSSPESHTITIPSNAAPGTTYYIGVYADYDQTVVESNETNNGSSAVAVTINQADLVVTDILMNGQSSLPSVRSGDSVSLDFDVRNQGTAPTIADVHMRWYWGTTSGSTANFIDQGSLGTLNGLAPGESERETDASWVIPNLAAGTYWLTGVIDWDGRVPESNEGNNTRSESFVVVRPDLVATGVSVTDTSVNPGQSITVNWTARNQGQASAGSTQQGVMWSTNNTINLSDVLLEREFLGAMAVNGTSPEAHTITIPTNATPGTTYYIGVYADYDLTESESDEGNNGSSAVAVTINQADLVVTDVLINGLTTLPNVRSGDSVSLDFDVRNQGTAPTIADVHMRWYWGTSSGSTANFIDQGSLGTINGLAPGESERETDAFWTIPNLASGTYWLTGVIDWDGRVSESNEGNNTRSESFIVLEPLKPDLVVTDILMNGQSSLSNVRSGDSVSLDFDVRNQGTAPTIADVHLRWYWGTSSGSTANFIDQGSLGTFNGLAPGESERETDASWAIPNLAAGTYWLSGVIDWDGRVPESNEGNNTRSESFVVLEPLRSDLVVQEIEINGVTELSPAIVQKDTRVTLDALAQNVGDDSTNPSVPYQWWWGYSSGDKNQQITNGNGNEVGSTIAEVNGLQPNEEEWVSEFLINGSKGAVPDKWVVNLAPGTYWLTFEIDAPNLNDEGPNEGNNTRSRSFTVVSQDQPDLIVTDIKMEGNTLLSAVAVQQGATVSIDALSKNVGAAGTGPSVPYIWWWGNSIGDKYQQITSGGGNDIDNFIATINGMGAGEEEWISESPFAIPDSDDWFVNLAPGTYWLTFEIDSPNVNDEGPNEGNNTHSESFTVLPPPQGISRVRWEDRNGIPVSDPVSQGTDLYLAVYASGFTTSQTFTANILDNDLLPDENDPAPGGSDLPVSFVSPGKWVGQWTAQWMEDAFNPLSIDSDPDYFFRLDGYGNTSEELKVLKPSITAIRWEDAAGNELPDGVSQNTGSTVYIEVDTQGMRGGSAAVYLYEDDGQLGIDDLINPPLSIQIPSNTDTGRIEWTVAWNTDSDLLTDYNPFQDYAPEYRLWDTTSFIGGITGVSSRLLEVTQPTAQWEDASGNLFTGSVPDGTVVYLAASNIEFSTTTQLSARVWENDITSFDDEIARNIELSYVSGNRWRGEWRTVWADDNFLDRVPRIPNLDNPEFFFQIDTFNSKSQDLEVTQTGSFGYKVHNHTEGTGVPLVLIHGTGSDTSPELDYRWQTLVNYLNDPLNADAFKEFDVYVWKHFTELPIGFNGAAGSQAAELADFVYADNPDGLRLGWSGSQYALGTKVLFVAHSQGGLVARSFMNHYNSTVGHKQGEDVLGLITLDTPHHGSPFAVPDWDAEMWTNYYGDGPVSFDLFSTLVGPGLPFLGGLGFNSNRRGDVNLAWDSMDGAISTSTSATFYSESLLPFFTYELTPSDGNDSRVSSDVTPFFYLQDLKDTWGTLLALNENEAYADKIVAYGAYDNDLGDNASFPTGEHNGLSWLTRLMSMMHSQQPVSGDYTSYYANDGMVPLQSSLFLNLSNDGAQFATLSGDTVTIDNAAIAAHKRSGVTTRIWSGADHAIENHLRVLDTTSVGYWQQLAYDIQSFLSVSNQSPVATSDSFALDEDAVLSVPAPGVLFNDNDANGDALTVELVSGPSHGTLALNRNTGQFSYRPSDNYYGPDSFTYKAFDGTSWSNVATVSIVVNPVNDAPVARNDAYTMDQNVAGNALLNIAALGVLGNDSDVDSTSLNVVRVSDPSHGSLLLNADGSFSYRPTGGYTGTDSFTYKVNDGQADSNVATVNITVNPVAGAPPTVESVVINDGSAQRSMVTSVTVTFNTVVTIDNLATAFQVINKTSGSPVGFVANRSDAGGKTAVTLTFSGPGVIGGSLADGNYLLKVFAGQVHAAGFDLDGNHDGTPQDDFTFGAEALDKFFRFYGDQDGDRDVDATDRFRFLGARGKTRGLAGYLWYFDYDNDGDVDSTGTDFDQFNARYAMQKLVF